MHIVDDTSALHRHEWTRPQPRARASPLPCFLASTPTAPTTLGEESSSRSLLAQFQRYTEQVEGGDPLTLQTVEVVGDAREGRALLAVGKGDFRVSKTPSTGELGVLEARASPAPPLHPRLCAPPLCAPPLSAARSAPPHLLLLRTFASTPPSLLPNASICALPSLRRASTRLRLMAWGNPRPRCHPPCDGLPLSSTLRCASPARRTAPSASTPRRACVMLLCHACGVHTRTTRKTAHHSHLPPAHSGGAGRHAGCHRAACRDAGGACGGGGGSRRHPAAVGSA